MTTRPPTAPPPTAPSPLRPSLWPHRLILLALALLLFLLACPLPALSGIQNHITPISMSGFSLLLIGWTGLFVGQFAWCANLLLPVAAILLLCRFWISSAFTALLGLLIAMHTFAILGRDLPADEGGANRMVYDALGPAFYYWIASFAALVLGGLYLRLRDRAR